LILATDPDKLLDPGQQSNTFESLASKIQAGTATQQEQELWGIFVKRCAEVQQTSGAVQGQTAGQMGQQRQRERDEVDNPAAAKKPATAEMVAERQDANVGSES
jgi:hypothetical protein